MEYKYSYREMMIASALAYYTSSMGYDENDSELYGEIYELMGENLVKQVNEIADKDILSREQTKEILKSLVVDLQKGVFA